MIQCHGSYCALISVSAACRMPSRLTGKTVTNELAVVLATMRFLETLRCPLCAFHDAALESAFRVHWVRKRRHQDALLLSVLVFAAIGLLANLMSTGEAAARAVAFCPAGAAAAAGRIITAAERLSGHVGAAGTRAVVQHLQAAVEGFPLHDSATLASKAVYTLAHAPQLLLYRVLVARDFLLGLCLVFIARFCWRTVRCWSMGHWPSNTSLVLFFTSWAMMRTVQAAAWFPVAAALAPTASSEGTFQRCFFTGIMAFWQRVTNRAGVFMLVLFLTQPLMVHVHVPVAIVEALCNIVSPIAAAFWAHHDPSCNRATFGVVLPAAHLSLRRSVAHSATILATGVLLPTAIMVVAERRMRAAFRLQHQQQHQQQQQQQQRQEGQQRLGLPYGQEQKQLQKQLQQQQQQEQQHESISTSTQPDGASSSSFSTMGAAYTDFSAREAAAVSAPTHLAQHTLPQHPVTAQQPTSTAAAVANGGRPKRTGNALYRSRFKTIVVSMTVFDAADLQSLELGGGHAGAMEFTTSITSQRQLPSTTLDTSGAATSSSTTRSLGAEIRRSMAARHTSITPQQLRSAVVAAAQKLVETGQLKAASIDCSCFRGCIHVAFGVLVDVDMDAAEQQQVAAQLVADSIEQLPNGIIQEAAELFVPSSPGSPETAAGALGMGSSGDQQQWPWCLRPVAVTAQQQQQQQQQEEGPGSCGADVYVQLPTEMVTPQAAAALVTLGDPAAVRLLAVSCNSDTVLSDSSWTASEVLGFRSKLVIQLPTAQLQSGLVHVMVLLHADLAEAWAGRCIFPNPANGDMLAAAVEAHGHEVLVAKLPLLVLPSLAAAREVQDLFDCMAGQAGGATVAYGQHLMPFAYDMACALGCSSGMAQAEPEQQVQLALLAFMQDAPVYMPCCSQLLTSRGKATSKDDQMPGGQTSSSHTAATPGEDQLRPPGAQPCSSSAAKRLEPPASRGLSGSQQQEPQQTLPLHVSLHQAVFGFEDAQLEQCYKALKPKLAAGLVLVVALMELVKVSLCLMGVYQRQ